MTHEGYGRLGHLWLNRLLPVLFFAFSFFSYLTFDFEHPPSHTCGGTAQCECPGDDAPDPGSMPKIEISPSQVLAFGALFLHEGPPLLPNGNEGILGEAPEVVPRLLLHELPPPILLI